MSQISSNEFWHIQRSWSNQQNIQSDSKQSECWYLTIIRYVVGKEKWWFESLTWTLMCRIYLWILWTLYSRDHSCGSWRPTANVTTCIGIKKDENLRTTYSRVIQERQELKNAYWRTKWGEVIHLLHIWVFSVSLQSFVVTERSSVNEEKYENDIFHTFVLVSLKITSVKRHSTDVIF